MIPGQDLTFQASATCTHHFQIGAQGVALDGDCSTPSGRRIDGSLAVSLGTGCHPFGLSVEYHLKVESAPGAGDSLLVDGAVNLGLGHRELNLSTTLEMQLRDDGHAVSQSVAACIILDGTKKLLAMNGHVTTTVDGTTLLNVQVNDLQSQLCETLPYTGTIEVMDPKDDFKVTFSQSSPTERRVTVLADGNTIDAQLPDDEPVRWCSDSTPAPTPMMIDYASCGGCSQPPQPTTQPPPSGGNGGNNTSGGNNGGPGGTGAPGGTGGTGGVGGNGV
jgi:hypothetical protein